MPKKDESTVPVLLQIRQGEYKQVGHVVKRFVSNPLPGGFRYDRRRKAVCSAWPRPRGDMDLLDDFVWKKLKVELHGGVKDKPGKVGST